MKTRVIMKREIMGVEIRQDSKDGLFSANDMNKIGNKYRVMNDMTIKQMAHYFNQSSTTELINAICIEENLDIKEVKRISHSGQTKGTWIHPIMFVDMVMWYSPELKVKIIKWVLDGLLSARNDSGDSFKEMNRSLTQNFPREFNHPISYSKAANQVAKACRVGTSKDKWQRASEAQLQLRKKIQENICLLADVTPNAGSCISKSIDKAIASERKKIRSDQNRRKGD